MVELLILHVKACGGRRCRRPACNDVAAWYSGSEIRRSSAPSVVQPLADRQYVRSQAVISIDLGRDLVTSVKNRGMITPPELFADFHQARFGFFAHQVHCNLARHDDIPGAAATFKNLEIDVVELRDGVDDRIIA